MPKASKKRRSTEHGPEHRTKTEANEQRTNTEQRTREEKQRPAGGPGPDPGPDSESVGSVPEQLLTEQPSPDQKIAAPEKSSVLAKKMVDLMKTMRRANYPMHEIASILKVSSSTVYYHTKDVTPAPQPAQSTTSDPPPSSLSQPVTPTAPPPKIVEVQDLNEPQNNETKATPEPESNGDGYGRYGNIPRETRRPPLPATDAETISELLMLFGRDMRRRGYTGFVDYFEDYVIPQFERTEFYMANLPGQTPEDKDRNFRRYLWIVTKFFVSQKEYADYEAAISNNGAKPEES